MSKKKLQVTAFCSCKNGEQYLRKALLSVDFCEQKIFLDDNSTDNSVNIAKELGWDVYTWTGPDSMCERRNYGIGWKGDDKHTPWWVKNSLPEIPVSNDFLLQVDHDEVFDDDTPGAMMQWYENDKKKQSAYGFLLKNVITEGPEAGDVMTSTPLPRLFKVGGVHWEEDIQNDTIFEGEIGWVGSVLYHYGYGSYRYHWEKQWSRLANNEDRVLRRPDDLMSRGYLINCLTVVGERDPYNFDRAISQVSIAVDDFLKVSKDETSQMVIQRILRHFFAVCMNLNRRTAFLWVLEKVEKYIDWIVDVPYWRLQCELYRTPLDPEAIDKQCKKYLSAMSKHKSPPIRGVEIMSSCKEVEMCQRLYQLFMDMLISSRIATTYKDRAPIAKKCEYWYKKIVLHQFYEAMEAEGLPQFYFETRLKRDMLDLPAKFLWSKPEEKKAMFNDMVQNIRSKK